MRYSDFETLLSKERTNKYLLACGNNKRKAIQLYKINMQLSQAMFSLISLLEISMRNSINNTMVELLGKDWIVNSFSTGIHFDRKSKVYKLPLDRLDNEGKLYSNSNMVSNLDFGFWRYIFKSNRIFEAVLKNFELGIINYNSSSNNYIVDIIDKVDVSDGIKTIKNIVNFIGAHKLDNIFNSTEMLEINSSIIKANIHSVNGFDVSICDSPAKISNTISQIEAIDKVNAKLSNANRNFVFNELHIMTSHSVWDYAKGISIERFIRRDNVVNFWVRDIFPKMPAHIAPSIIFNDLKSTNNMRNRIAHHDPICFRNGNIDSSYVSGEYSKIMKYFGWLDVDVRSFLSGIDNINVLVNKLNNI